MPRLSNEAQINLIFNPYTLDKLSITLLQFDESFKDNSIFVVVLQNNLQIPGQLNSFRQSSEYPGFVKNPTFVQRSACDEVRDVSFLPFQVTSITVYSYLFHNPVIYVCQKEVLQNLRTECHRPSAILDIIADHLNVTIESQFVSPFNKNNFNSFYLD